MNDGEPEVLRGRTFKNRSLRGSRFVDCDLGGVVVRGSEVAGMVVTPVAAGGRRQPPCQRCQRCALGRCRAEPALPGRQLRTAEDPEGLRTAWAALERTWAATLDRPTAMPAGTIDVSVDGEWSLAQTLRHLVMATDTWLGKGILRQEQPYHPAGLPNDDRDSDAYDDDVFSAPAPSFAEVVEARGDRQRMVREFLAALTPEVLTQPRKNPHAPGYEETVLSCLRTILEEEWEHHRYAVRDLDSISTARPADE